MAIALFYSSTMTFVKLIELSVDQTTATPTMAILNKSRFMPSFLRNTMAKAAKLMGNTQYPKTQILWKKLMWPPSNLLFIVTRKAPPHIITKMMPNDLPSAITIKSYLYRFRNSECYVKELNLQ